MIDLYKENAFWSGALFPSEESDPNDPNGTQSTLWVGVGLYSAALFFVLVVFLWASLTKRYRRKLKSLDLVVDKKSLVVEYLFKAFVVFFLVCMYLFSCFYFIAFSVFFFFFLIVSLSFLLFSSVFFFLTFFMVFLLFSFPFCN